MVLLQCTVVIVKGVSGVHAGVISLYTIRAELRREVYSCQTRDVHVLSLGGVDRCELCVCLCMCMCVRVCVYVCMCVPNPNES